jgi:hypothetical protein
MFVSAKPADAGTWYYGMKCQQCEKPIALFKDESRGKVRFPYNGNVLIVTGCPTCKAKKLAYKANAIRAYLA